MMTRQLPFVAVAMMATSFLSPRAEACCMVPVTYSGSIGQTMQEAVVFHADGREELILGIDYKLKSDSKKGSAELPPYFAWVITVPNEPDRYELAERDLFKAVFDWGNRKVTKPKDTQGLRKAAGIIPAAETDGLIISKKVEIGPYEIQPVKATGVEALDGLNAWLKTNGFPQEDVGHMTYFVKGGFTFLCVKVHPPKGETSVAGSGELKPLHLSFASESPYYPLRFSSRQGVFGINVWMFTENAIDLKQAAPVLGRLGGDVPKRRWNGKWSSDVYHNNVEVQTTDLPKQLTTALKGLETKEIKTVERWNLNLVRSKSVNLAVPIIDWENDIFLPLAAK